MIYTGLNGSGEVEAVYAAKRATTTGTPPLSYPSKGYDLEDFLISGNTVQNGTPTPSDPVDVVGCGVWDEVRQSYKLPLTVNDTEYPIYLGQVQTTRKIKKLVLTGSESYTYQSQYSRYVFTVQNAFADGTRLTQCFCTHYRSVHNGEPIELVPDKSIYINYQVLGTQFCIKDEGLTSIADFESYLTAQYANGTPIIIWYILTATETAITNEPLHKIGDYADTISLSQSGITVPTTKGVNTITAETTVLPSSISVTTPEKEVAEVYAGINYQNPIYYKTRTLTGTSPLTFKGLGQPLKDYHIFGETVQNGTPSPDYPVDVQGTGEKTANLWNPESDIFGYIDMSGGITESIATKSSDYIAVDPNAYYCVALSESQGLFSTNQRVVAFYNTNKEYIRRVVYDTVYPNTEIIFDVPSDARYIRVSYDTSYMKTMLNTGTTALPYEPYGYKIPVTIGNVTTPIYIGSDPLYRVGDYADEIDFANQRLVRRIDPATLQPYATPITSAITVPQLTAAVGDNTLTVDTTVKPSAASITGHIKPTGYGQLLDINDVDIQDSTGEPIYIQG